MKSKFVIIILILGIVLGSWFYYNKVILRKNASVSYREIQPEYGIVREIISATGMVEPQNRLSIIPPISGRIDRIFVEEGSEVRAGQQLALMSSTDRAALLDAASTQGAEKIQYWSDVYKPTPILAPIAGRIIVRSIEPGQTVNSSTTILVLADVLIVNAQIDETDIGKVSVGQITNITLDAYPDVKITGKVKRISYESKIVNNVTIYTVEIAPDNIPSIFRSGMSANIEIIRKQKDAVLLIPESAVDYTADKPTVLLKDGQQRVAVETGMSQDGLIEIISGLQETDTVLAAERGNILRGTAGGTPFGGPGGRRR